MHQHCYTFIDSVTRIFVLNMCSKRDWLTLRTQVCLAAGLTIHGLVAVNSPKTYGAGSFGFVALMFFQIMNSLRVQLPEALNAPTNFTAVKRMKEYEEDIPK